MGAEGGAPVSTMVEYTTRGAAATNRTGLKIPCQYCGTRLRGGAIEAHEKRCVSNPAITPTRKYLRIPCACGRKDKRGAPYLQDHQGGPCWACYRDAHPELYRELDELTQLVRAGAGDQPRVRLQLGGGR